MPVSYRLELFPLIKNLSKGIPSFIGERLFGADLIRKPMKQAIPYYRVSTERQGRSGLGLDAQRQAIEQFAKAHGYELLTEFIEVESGASSARAVLKEAIEACRIQGAVLLIAKLDRLARNVAFVASLMESEVRFMAADHPWVDDIILHILAAFAQHERKMTSERTKAALAAAKARGVQLGKYGKEVLSERNRQQADDFALGMQPVLNRLKEKGITTVRAIARELNRRRVPTFRKGGHKWHPSTVHGLLARLADKGQAGNNP